MHTFTVSSFRGGTAKTSTSLHVGDCLAQFHNKRVLLINFDSQANLSIGPDDLKTMVPVFHEDCSIKDVIQSTSIPGLSLIPADAYLDGIERTPQLWERPLKPTNTLEGL